MGFEPIKTSGYFLCNSELTNLAKHLYEDCFPDYFKGYVEWSTRMKNISGNCREDGRIGLNYNYFLEYGLEETINILKHELAHLYCFKMIGDHNHNDICFLNALTMINGAIYGKYLPRKVHTYSCPKCQKIWLCSRKKEGNYSCSHCGGNRYSEICKLIYSGVKFI